MTALSPVSRLQLPTDDDILDFNAISGNFCTGIDSLLLPRYSSTSARDAANSGGATAGQMCAVVDASGSAHLQSYEGGSWKTLEDIDVVYRSSNLARSLTTTPTDDTEIVMTLLPNSTYHIKARLSWFCSSASPGIRVCWGTTGGSSTVINRNTNGGNGGTAAGQPGMSVRRSNLSDQITRDLPANTWKHHEEDLVLAIGSSSVTLSLQWAQKTNSASSLILGTGTFAEYNRL